MGVPAPQMALAAHNIGIIQGTLAIALAFLWPRLTENGFPLRISRIALLVGFYCNWLGALLSAFWSAKKMATVSGAEMPDVAAPWQELTVAILLNLSILVLLVFLRLVYVVAVVGKRKAHANS